MRYADCGLRTAVAVLTVILLSAQAPERLCAQATTLPLNADGSIRVFNPAGTIRIIGWDKDSVRWVGELAPGQQLFGGGSPRMAKVGVGGADAAARLTVQVPRRAKVVIDAAESGVDVEGVRGPIEISGGGGAIRLTGSPVRVTIQTVDGAVTLTGGPFRSTEVRTAGGMIRVEGARGELVLSSVTGAIFAEADSITRGGITTVAGVIRLGASVDPTGTLTVESHGGDIQLRFDPGAGLEVVATAFGGNIENTLSAARPRPVRNGRGQQLGTTVGNGGGTVTVTSFKGRVRIQPR